MLNSYYNDRDSIAVTLMEAGKRHISLTEMEDTLKKDWVKVLKCFKESSKCLQGDRYGTLHMVPLADILMRRSLQEYYEVEMGVSSLFVMPNLLKNLHKRFTLQDVHKVAGILNPSLNMLIDYTLEEKSKMVYNCFLKFNLIRSLIRQHPPGTLRNLQSREIPI